MSVSATGPLFSTVAHGPVGHDRSLKMVVLVPTDSGTVANFRPVLHAPVGHHRLKKTDRVGSRLPPGAAVKGRLAPGAVRPKNSVALGGPEGTTDCRSRRGSTHSGFFFCRCPRRPFRSIVTSRLRHYRNPGVAKRGVSRLIERRTRGRAYSPARISDSTASSATSSATTTWETINSSMPRARIASRRARISSGPPETAKVSTSSSVISPVAVTG